MGYPQFAVRLRIGWGSWASERAIVVIYDRLREDESWFSRRIRR